MADKKYKVKIKIDYGKTIYSVDVVACNEDQACEFAYDLFEHDSYCDVEEIEENE